MAEFEKDYVSVVYNERNRPFTEYPDRLTRYLVDRYALSHRYRLLDLGCGRGEFLRGFQRCGLQVFGADQSSVAKELCPDAEIRIADFENTTIPYDEGFFDVVYSKSVLEHFYYPERLVREIHRVLKPGGLAITMVPDWEYNMRIYFEDYTHRTPFTLSSLRDIQLMHGFQDVRVERFRQLPFLWKRPWLSPLCSLLASATPSGAREYSKLIRFSKEIMLLASGVKPVAAG